MTTHELRHFTVGHDADGVVTVTLDVADRSVNVFDAEVVAELETVVSDLEQDTTAKAVVFRSGKSSGFLAGADVKQIASLTTPDQAEEIIARGQDLFARIERLSIPTLAAIHGPCLGGGLEFALSCDYRIARDDAGTRIGLPETQLGLLPAWGGTQRLPRVAGLIPALSMILQGTKLTPQKARKLSVVDEVVAPDDFDAAVHRFAVLLAEGKSLPSSRPSRSLMTRIAEGSRLGRWFVFRRTRQRIARNARNYPALGEVVEAVRRGVQQSSAAGFAYEREAFSRLLFTPTCRNLLGLFFQRERARSVKTWADDSLRESQSSAHEASRSHADVRKLGVVGAGAMGAGIAQLAAYNGLEVVLKDVDQSALDKGVAQIHKLFDDAVQSKRLRPDAAVQRKSAVTSTLDWDAFADCDVVVEAVVERTDVKQQVFAELENRVKPEALLTSNTSSLSVTELGTGLARPEQVAGLHFFNPVHRMELVEIVRTSATSPDTLARLLRLTRSLGKTPIVVRDRPGFLVNRMLFPYLAEAVRVVDEGVDAETIDRALKRFGMPMGPLELLDQIGLDVAEHVARSMAAVQPDSETTAVRLSSMVARGVLGKKSGSGFYEYKRGRRGKPVAMWEQNEHKDAVDPGPVDLRLILAMVNEAAKCLDEQIVPEAWMIDLAMVLGTGFAPFRGGPLRVADDRGLQQTVNDLRRLEKSHGQRFAPCELLVRMSDEEQTFYNDSTTPPPAQVQGTAHAAL